MYASRACGSSHARRAWSSDLSQFAGNLMYLGATEEAYAPLAAQLRQFIDDAEAVARARRTRRESESKGDAGVPEGETG